jgi:hypothetical protein
MSKKYNSHCIICKKPAHAPKGNFNARAVTLCKSKKCVRQRRTELQRERRKQKLLELTFEPIKAKEQVKLTRSGKKSKHDSMPKSPSARAARKRAFFGGGESGSVMTNLMGAPA